MLPPGTYPSPEVNEPSIVAEIYERNRHLVLYYLTQAESPRASFGETDPVLFVDIGSVHPHGL